MFRMTCSTRCGSVVLFGCQHFLSCGHALQTLARIFWTLLCLHAVDVMLMCSNLSMFLLPYKQMQSFSTWIWLGICLCYPGLIETCLGGPDLNCFELVEQSSEVAMMWALTLFCRSQVPSEGCYRRQNLFLTCTNKDSAHGAADHKAWDYRYWWARIRLL